MVEANNTYRLWAPPHCPNPSCAHFHPQEEHWHYIEYGTYRVQNSPRRIQRYRCTHCHRTFSTQTFSTTYWMRRPDLLRRVFKRTVNCGANRQLARDLGVAPATIDNVIARLGRHAMLFHCWQMRGLEPPAEVVVDGFESFEWSQYYPLHHHVAVGKGTDFFYSFTDSPLRRKGRMTPVQKRRRALLEATHGRPDPKAVEMDMKELLENVLQGHPAKVFSDDHPAYRRAIAKMDQEIEHDITPGKAHRDRHNPLWEVNLLDLLIRHSSANHKRETIAWSKRRQASAERLAILLVWRNYIKRRREKQRGSPTPAMAVGLVDRPLGVEDILERRLFPGRIDMPDRWRRYYSRTIRTVALGRNRAHELKYAF